MSKTTEKTSLHQPCQLIHSMPDVVSKVVSCFLLCCYLFICRWIPFCHDDPWDWRWWRCFLFSRMFSFVFFFFPFFSLRDSGPDSRLPLTGPTRDSLLRVPQETLSWRPPLFVVPSSLLLKEEEEESTWIPLLQEMDSRQEEMVFLNTKRLQRMSILRPETEGIHRRIGMQGVPLNTSVPDAFKTSNRPSFGE